MSVRIIQIKIAIEIGNSYSADLFDPDFDSDFDPEKVVSGTIKA